MSSSSGILFLLGIITLVVVLPPLLVLRLLLLVTPLDALVFEPLLPELCELWVLRLEAIDVILADDGPLVRCSLSRTRPTGPRIMIGKSGAVLLLFILGRLVGVMRGEEVGGVGETERFAAADPKPRCHFFPAEEGVAESRTPSPRRA